MYEMTYFSKLSSHKSKQWAGGEAIVDAEPLVLFNTIVVADKCYT